jgi:hypothetical protein
MMLAITGQWVAEVTLVICLFGAACIGLAITAGDWGGGDAASGAKGYPAKIAGDSSGTRTLRLS